MWTAVVYVHYNSRAYITAIYNVAAHDLFILSNSDKFMLKKLSNNFYLTKLNSKYM